MKTKEISNLLEISTEALKSVMKRGQLAARLCEKGYDLIKVEKIGRSNEFTIKEIEEVTVSIPVDVWRDYMKEKHPSVRKIDARKTYYQERMIKETLMIKDIANSSKISRDTVRRWDKEEVKDGLLIDHGYAYFKLTPQGPIQVTYAEFIHQDGDLTDEEMDIYNTVAKDNKVSEREFKIATRGLYIRTRHFLVNKFTEEYQKLEKAMLENRAN